MQRAYSLEKNMMLGKTEVRRRMGWQRMRCLNGIIDSMDMGLSKLWEGVKNWEAWRATVHGVAKSRTRPSDWTKWPGAQCWWLVGGLIPFQDGHFTEITWAFSQPGGWVPRTDGLRSSSSYHCLKHRSRLLCSVDQAVTASVQFWRAKYLKSNKELAAVFNKNKVSCLGFKNRENGNTRQRGHKVFKVTRLECRANILF